MSSSVEETARALAAGRPVVLPTDTVYGLACTPHDPGAARRLYRLKGRAARQPTALVAAGVDVLLEHVPELRGGPERVARALLPGPYTLVLPNPARRFSWLTGDRPDTIGVRVPSLAGPARELLERVGVVAATSANLAGGRDPARLAELADEVRTGAAALLDGGELPGTASTVVDCTGSEPAVLREGAAPAAEALARVRAALG